MRRRSGLRGAIDGLQGRGIGGWVFREDAPERRLWVETLADGVSVGVGRADLFHPQCPSPDGCHGFWIPLPPMVLEAGCRLDVILANTGEAVAPGLDLPHASSEPALAGLEYDLGLQVTGWAVDPADPGRAVRVAALERGRILAEVWANGRRLAPAVADGHGFSLTLPPELADGEAHWVELVTDRDTPLPGSPLQVQVVPQGLAGVARRLPRALRSLVTVALERYERALPRSVGFAGAAHWQEWFPVTAAPQAEDVGVCVLGRMLTAEEQTVVRQELGPRCRVYLTIPGDVPGARVFPTAGEAVAAAVAQHRWVAVLDPLHALAPGGLAALCAAAQDTGAALVFGDLQGEVPQHNPVFDRFHFLEHDYLGPLLVDARPWRGGLPAVAHPAALRVHLALHARVGGIWHLPELVGRLLPLDEAAAQDWGAARRAAIGQWLAAAAPGATVDAHPCFPHLSRVHWPLRQAPLVSIIIPTRDRGDLLAACLDSLLAVTQYPRLEVLIVDNGTVEPAAKRVLARARRQGAIVLSAPGPFNYAALNNLAARQARGQWLCLLNNDTEFHDPGWLARLVALAAQPGVGAVGAKLLWPNGMVQHGGVVVGVHGLAAHVGTLWSADDPGYAWRNQITQQWSAVTAACLLTPRELYLGVGGLDAMAFPVAFNDVEYCLRVRQQGQAVVWTPHSVLVHHESASRGTDQPLPQRMRAEREMAIFRQRWGQWDDPYYNPNLGLSTLLPPFHGLAFPPRPRRPRQ